MLLLKRNNRVKHKHGLITILFLGGWEENINQCHPKEALLCDTSCLLAKRNALGWIGMGGELMSDANGKVQN